MNIGCFEGDWGKQKIGPSPIPYRIRFLLVSCDMADRRDPAIRLRALEISACKEEIENIKKEIASFINSRLGLFPTKSERDGLAHHPKNS